MKHNIICIIVIYKQKEKILNDVIDSLIDQVNKIIIINNNYLSDYSFYKINNKIEIINLNENIGIASAQNIGIKKAIAYGADFILTSDQDTLYPHDYIIKLLEIYYKYYTTLKVAAIAPIFYDINTNNIVKICEKSKNNIKILTFNKMLSNDIILASHVISSGMVIPVKVFNEIGFMKDKYFIDWVDTEWCFRAISKKFVIIQSPKIIINHQHGDESKKLINYKITIHNDIRKYYRVRNAIFMLFYEKYLTRYMKKYIIIFLIKMIISHFYFSKNKIKELFNKYFAIKDAINKNMGKCKHFIIR